MAYLFSSLADFYPRLLIVSFALFAFIWILSYFLEWLRELENSARTAQTTACLEDPTSLEKTPCPSLFDPAQKYISLIIPAFNEEDRLPVYLDETLRYLQRRALNDKTFTYEIIIVDDGSTDKTVKVAFDYVRRHTLDHVRVLKQGTNFGKGAAVRKGMLCARGDLLLMLDADGATKITDLEKLEIEIKSMTEQQAVRKSSTAKGESSQGGWDSSAVVFGSRAHLEKKALSTRKWYRNFLMKGFHFCVLLVAGGGVRDTQCGFKMFTRAAAQNLFVNLRLKRLGATIYSRRIIQCKCLGVLWRSLAHQISGGWMRSPLITAGRGYSTHKQAVTASSFMHLLLHFFAQVVL